MYRGVYERPPLITEFTQRSIPSEKGEAMGKSAKVVALEKSDERRNFRLMSQ